MGNCLPKRSKAKKKKGSSGLENADTDSTHEVLSRVSEFKKTKPNAPSDMVKALAKAKEHDTDDVSIKKLRKSAGNRTPLTVKPTTSCETVKPDTQSGASKAANEAKRSSDDEMKKIMDEILREEAPIEAAIKKPKTQAHLEETPAASTEKKDKSSFDDELEELMDEILEQDNAKFEAKVKNRQPVAFDVNMNNEHNKKPKMPARLAERLTAPKEKKSELDYTEDEEQLMAEILREDKLYERKEKARKEDIKIYDAKRKRKCLEMSRECEMKQKQNSEIPDKTEQRKKVKQMAEESRRKAAEKRGAANEQQ